jgi:hypothetical protein
MNYLTYWGSYGCINEAPIIMAYVDDHVKDLAHIGVAMDVCLFDV